ncbi:MAG: LD-carboxypeptidase [Oscillospiraceae bacterium]|nr:LD-carboxypeptidase [Oscillospiraceae bacterium]
MIQTVGIVSLSSGIIGESFVRHELDLGIRRLEEMGLRVKFLPHALGGLDNVKNHPEERAQDLLDAFRDPEINLILCAIGGDDTYRLLPALFDSGALAEAVRNKPFLGFSDTTVNHLMLHKLGLPSFYGQSFLADICEMEKDMLPYTRHYFEELIRTGTIRTVTPSPVWYEERTSFGPDQMGLPRVSHPNGGFELLQGKPVFSGRILGGCIDSIYDLLTGARYGDEHILCERYGLFPSAEDWRGRILLLESSEEKMAPALYEKTLRLLKERGIFSAVSGVLTGKPMDGSYETEYKEALVRVIGDPGLPVVCNLSIGHAAPRCILPFGVEARVDVERQRIDFSV